MRFVLGLFKASFTMILAFGIANESRAGVIVNINQVGSDIVATVSGSLPTSGLSLTGGGSPQGSVLSVYQSEPFMGLPASNEFAMSNGTANYNSYAITQTSGGTVWSSSDLQLSPFSTVTTVDHFGLSYRETYGEFNISNSYTGGTFSGTVTFENQSLSSLGFNLGTFIYTIVNTTETITVNIGSSAAVPEPTSMAIFGLGALGLAYHKRRKLKA